MRTRGKRGWLVTVALLTILTAGVALAGCTRQIAGDATGSFGDIDPGKVAGLAVTDGPSGPRQGVDDATLPVRNGDGGAEDRLAVNAISDVLDYWTAELPRTFGKDFAPLRKFVSYDSRGKTIRICDSRSKGLINAFYCPSDDSIGWDRGLLLPFVRQRFGDLAVVSIFAHEMGHAVQYRIAKQTGITHDSPSIVKEQQADCFAGAFFRWVALGHAKHFQMSTGDGLNQVLATMLFIRDEPGQGSYDEQGAHGSAFDRVYALQTGFADGTKRCSRIDKREVDNRVTQIPLNEQDVAGGNLGLNKETIGLLEQSLGNAFSQTGTPAPRIISGDGRCAGGMGTPPASFCPDGNTLNIDVAKLARYGTPPGPDSNIAYGEGGIGDFAPFAEIASRYALAVQHHLGIPLDDPKAGLRTTCLTGAWAGFAKHRAGEATRQLLLSPGDLDEAIAELLMARSVISANDRGDRVRSGFARIEAFRAGYLSGSRTCTDRFR